MRRLLTISFGLISLLTSGQEKITESLIYELTARTIKDFTNTKLKIHKSVTTPTIFWDTENKKPKTGNYLSDADLEIIPNQINNPIIKTWYIDLFREMKNVRMVDRLKRNNCLLISLPIISADKRTIIISYQTWDKNSGAGFLTIWKKVDNEWTKEKDIMIWITSRESSPLFDIRNVGQTTKGMVIRSHDSSGVKFPDHRSYDSDFDIANVEEHLGKVALRLRLA